MLNSGPLVFAHRGSSEAFAEHTLDAYLRAIEEGADGLECDVRLTRDRHLVCIHDRRLNRTSNGRGVVSATTLASLAELDFGSWHSGRSSAAAGVLTLDRLLTVAIKAGRPLRLLIETKHPTRYGGSVERALLEVLRGYGLHEADATAPVQVTVMSFSVLALRRMRVLAPMLPTVFLFDWAPPGVRGGAVPFGAVALGPGVAALRAYPELVKRAHAQGHEVYCWTANTEAEVDLLLDRGVDGIISDRPGYVLSRLGR